MQALFDEGALVRNGAVKVTRSLSQLRLPPTVQGILASRIDRLVGGAEGTAPDARGDRPGVAAWPDQESGLQGGAATGADAGGFAGGRVHLRAAGAHRC